MLASNRRHKVLALVLLDVKLKACGHRFLGPRAMSGVGFRCNVPVKALSVTDHRKRLILA